MRIGAFELTDDVPELREPHALVVIQPLIDIGNVGNLILTRLESDLHALELGRLACPGNFLDFTRYRPSIHLKEGRQEIIVPNTTMTYAKRKEAPDFIFMRVLEPHNLAEEYIDSILQVLIKFGVKRYCVIGATYDMVPYTRPLLVSARASTPVLEEQLAEAKVITSDYQGFTSITALISQQAAEMGIEVASLIVHLPGYLTIDDDYRGVIRMMEVLSALYSFPVDAAEVEKARGQKEHVSQIAERIMKEQPQLRVILQQMEASYNSRIQQDGTDGIQLSPDIEKFLQDMDRQFRRG